MRRIAEQGFAPFVWCCHADRHGDCLSNHADRYHQQRKACAGGVNVGLEPGFVCHVVSVALTVSTDRTETGADPGIKQAHRERRVVHYPHNLILQPSKLENETHAYKM